MDVKTMIPHLRLSQDVYVRLYSSISDTTGSQAILYGVCEECLGQGLVARVKGLIPYYSYGSEFEAILASIVARSDVTILGIAVIPDEQTAKQSTTHEIASSYLLALQTALVKVVSAARSSGHTDDGYFNQKIAKECAAWFRDLVVLVGDKFTVNAATSSLSSSSSSSSWSSSNELNHENFYTRLRFFVNASITTNDVLTMIQCKSTYDTARIHGGKSIPLKELNNTAFDGQFSEGGTSNNNDDVQHRFTPKGKIRKPPIEDKETSTTMEREIISNGYDDGELANNEVDDGDEEMEEGLESDDEGGDSEMEVGLDEDEDGDATMSEETAGYSRQHTPLEMESNDIAHSIYYGGSDNNATMYDSFTSTNSSRVTSSKNRQPPSKLAKRKTAMCASDTGILKLPRLTTPRLNEKFTIEKGQETLYLQKVLGETSLINCTNEDERELTESIDILLEESTSDRLDRLERKQHALEGIIRKLGGKIDTYAESHQEYMGLVYLWQWLSLPSDVILQRLDAIAMGQSVLSSSLSANDTHLTTNNQMANLEIQPPLTSVQQQQRRASVYTHHGYWHNQTNADICEMSPSFANQPTALNEFTSSKFLDEHSHNATITSLQYSRHHSHYSRRSANRPRDPDSTDTEPEPELLSLNHSTPRTTIMDTSSTTTNITPSNTITSYSDNSNLYNATMDKPLRTHPAPTSDLYTLASIALPPDTPSDVLVGSTDTTTTKPYEDAVSTLTSEPVSDSPLPPAQD